MLDLPFEAAGTAVDIGPLTWVLSEIDQALARGLAELKAFAADPAEATALKHARTHIHQATGAIQMVGLDAVVAFTDEMERLLVRLEEADAGEIAEACPAIDRAGRRLSVFLNELVNGAPLVALRLLPEYEAMQKARGLPATTPADLFFPDLSPRATLPPATPEITGRTLASHLIMQRRLFQRGLLSWIRGEEIGAHTMREAVSAVEGISVAANVRLFWWTVGALLDAINGKGLEATLTVKQLVARIDMQIRRLADGSSKVADRLRREVLYYCAISSPSIPTVREVQRVFKLASLLPYADVPSADMLRVQPLLAQAREQLALAKEAWLKLTAGRAENLQRLKQTMSIVHQHSVEIGNAPLVKLIGSLTSRLDNIPALKVSEALALEYATALLFAENAFDNYANLGREFPQQVDAMLSRLDAAQGGVADPSAALPLLDEMSKRAQERLLLANVCREVQSNLRRMEQVLDSFFRDQSKRGDLTALAIDSRQVRGALSMLGLQRAEQLLALCQDQIATFATARKPVADEDLELLAESLLTLGFYVEAVEQQRPNPDRLIAPLLARRLGEPEQARTEPPPPAAPAPPPMFDEGVIEYTRELIDFDQPAAEAPLPPPTAPSISAETQRLLATDEKKLDAEFLEIYLNEANEVLDTIAQNRAVLERDSTSRDALRTVRRGFHTLKGSGRMVGLTELGDIAYGVEKIHNRLLEDDRPVTPPVLAMIVLAEKSFRQWLSELQRSGGVRPDASELHAAIFGIEGQWAVDQPPPFDSEEIEVQDVAPQSDTLDAGLEHEPEAPVVQPAPKAAPRPKAPRAPLIDFDHLFDLGSTAGGAPEVAPDESAPIGIETAIARFDSEPPVETAIPEDAAMLQAPLDERAVAAERLGEDEDIIVGLVALKLPLFRVLVTESTQHLAALTQECNAMQVNASLAPSGHMVRAGHTLCGIHRTVGFTLVAQTAGYLEQGLLALQHQGAPLPPSALSVVSRAIEVLGELVNRIARQQAFTEHDRALALQVQYSLEALRHETSGEAGAPDAESQAMRDAVRDEALHGVDDQTIDAFPEPTPAIGEPVSLPELSGVGEPASAAEEPQFVDMSEAMVSVEPAAVDGGQTDELIGSQSEQPAPAETVIASLDVPVRDDVDPQVMPIFLEEAAELFPQAVNEHEAWRRDPGNADAAHRLRRTLHTFKGSARMSGAMRLGELTHRMESRLLDGESLAQPTPELFDALAADLDQMGFLLDALRTGSSEVPARVVELPPEPVKVVPLVPRQPAPMAAAPAPAAPSAIPAELDAAQRALLRVRADLVDRLVNEAGEMAISRARVDSELHALKANLLELTSSVIRLRTQVREIEIQGESQISSRLPHASEGMEGFDPLEFDRYTRFQELTRSLTEGVNDVATVQQSLLKNIDDAEVALLSQSRLLREMQQQLFAIRTVPFGSLSERLYRILRQTAKELDKRANLEIQGGQVELDRSVLEKLVGPLEHLLRNALDHGIESRDARLRAGKSEIGEITLNVRQVGNEIVIELADDGGGLDLAQIRAKAHAQGRFGADQTPSDAQVMDCIFLPGFSTATRVTALSGRGIGMDVVRSEVAALGGRVEVLTQPGHGTTFHLYLPLTLAVAQAVLLRAGGRAWAIPSPMVEQVQQVKADTLRELYEAGAVEWQGRRFSLHYLPRLLGDTQHHPESGRYNPVLLLRAGQNIAAIHVDEVIGHQEVVVKNIGPQLARVSGIVGATVLGNGEIVLIINPVQLAQRTDLPLFDPNAPDQVVAAPPQSHRLPVVTTPLVMIVDDSLTVRKVTSRLLSREGFTVVTARDGADALSLLQEHTPDVILLDIEMPRLDGFEFTRTIKGMPRHAHIPIIMITSRTAEKHRTLARELGVDLYLGKPFQEQELIRHLREMLALTP